MDINIHFEKLLKAVSVEEVIVLFPTMLWGTRFGTGDPRSAPSKARALKDYSTSYKRINNVKVL